MTNESNEVKKTDEITFEVSGQTIKLSPSIVSQFITKGNTQISKTEAVNFMNLCRYAELNPFLNEAYLIKYQKDKPADMVVSKEAFMKRAHRQSQFAGYEAGVIVEDPDGNEVYKIGQFVGSKNTLVGGWSKVYRTDIDRPFEVAVELAEYSTGKSTWNKMPANMIRKVALVNGLREAFPEALGAMYTEEEPARSGLSDDNSPMKPVDVVDAEASILDGFDSETDDSNPVDVAFEEVRDDDDKQATLFRGTTLQFESE